MELKINYQFTYFIHPFVIENGKLKKYLMKMLNDKNAKLKIFDKEKDFKLYKYFSPKMRNKMFSNMVVSEKNINNFKELNVETRAALLLEYDCNVFEYQLDKSIQGKLDDKRGIFFNISKVEIVCFKEGICFLILKTDIAENLTFQNVLNFNYKFRDINSHQTVLGDSDGIRLQTSDFEDVQKLKEFIENITELNYEKSAINKEIERLYTFSYLCIDQENWGNNANFQNIEEQFVKYANMLSADSSENYDYSQMNVISKWKYAKLAITPKSAAMMTSMQDISNYTILLNVFENEYLYTYLINLKTKIFLSKIREELSKTKKMERQTKKFIEFSKKDWNIELTEDEIGQGFNENLIKKLQIEKAYIEIKQLFDLIYKNMNIKKLRTTGIIIGIILCITLLFNAYNYGIILNG